MTTAAVQSSIDVVIPVHNGWELTRSCLQHLAAQTVRHRVIVADNGSTDETRQLIRDEFPDVHLLELGSNRGFPAACNRGVRAGDGEIVVLLNNDVDCRSDFLERLVAPFAADERLGSAAALLVKPQDDSIDSFGLAVDEILAGYPRLRDRPVQDANATTPVLVGPLGGAGAYRRSAWDDVGGLDEGVFIYGEDVELAIRLRAAGWRTIGVPDAVGVHHGSATMGTRSAWQRYQAGFARGYFLRRYGMLRARVAPRVVATETLVVAGDALIFSHDLAALRGRIAGWRAARGASRKPRPPQEAVDHEITFVESLRRRVGVYTERDLSSSS